MTTILRSVVANFAAVAFAVTMLTLTPSSVLAAPPYDRPNAMTCVAGAIIVDAPTSVPVIGPVVWQAEMQGYNTATKQWEVIFRSAFYYNTADRVYVTAGPWVTADGNPHYSTIATLPPGAGPVEVRVYNHFWQSGQDPWVYVNAGWFSTDDGTATGRQTCVIDDRPIVA
jgi:hypothetical protein